MTRFKDTKECLFCGCPVVDEGVFLPLVDAVKLSNWWTARTGVQLDSEFIQAGSWSCMNCVRGAKQFCEKKSLGNCEWWPNLNDPYYQFYLNGWMKSCSVPLEKLPLAVLALHQERADCISAEKTDYEHLIDNYTGQEPKSATFPCSECDKEFEDEDSLSVHVKLHPAKNKRLGGMKFSCKGCDRVFLTFTLYKMHQDKCKMIKKHKIPRIRKKKMKKRYRCSTCGLKTSSKSQLTNHIKSLHLKKKVVSAKAPSPSSSSAAAAAAEDFVVCNDCSMLLSSSRFKSHNCHLKDDAFSGFQCTHCDFETNLRLFLVDHMLQTHQLGTVPQKCIYCMVSYINTFDRFGHFCPNRPKVTCTHCECSLYKEYLFQHQLPQRCHVCQKWYPCELLFRIHCGERSFSCHVCEEVFCQKEFLINHIILNHPQANEVVTNWKGGQFAKGGQKCEACCIYFRLAIHQKKHNAFYHSGLVCDMCGKWCRDLALLTSHMSETHRCKVANHPDSYQFLKYVKKLMDKLEGTSEQSTEEVPSLDLEKNQTLEAIQEDPEVIVLDDDDDEEQEVVMDKVGDARQTSEMDHQDVAMEDVEDFSTKLNEVETTSGKTVEIMFNVVCSEDVVLEKHSSLDIVQETDVAEKLKAQEEVSKEAPEEKIDQAVTSEKVVTLDTDEGPEIIMFDDEEPPVEELVETADKEVVQKEVTDELKETAAPPVVEVIDIEDDVEDESPSPQKNELTLHCPLCSQPVADMMDSKKHLQDTHSIIGYIVASSVICIKNCEFVTKTELRITYNDRGREFKCGYCQKKFFSESKTQAHILRIHKFVSCTCSICKTKCCTYDEFSKHLLTIHRGFPQYSIAAFSEVLISQRNKLHPCYICLQYFKTEELQKQHVMENHVEDAVRLLVDGMRIVSKDEAKCKKCNNYFKTKEDCFNHIKSEYALSYCKYCSALITAKELQLHMSCYHTSSPESQSPSFSSGPQLNLTPKPNLQPNPTQKIIPQKNPPLSFPIWPLPNLKTPAPKPQQNPTPRNPTPTTKSNKPLPTSIIGTNPLKKSSQAIVIATAQVQDEVLVLIPKPL